MITEPIFFEENRVGRVYTGGRLFADFFGDNSEDGFFPEEWIASHVKAINKISAGEREGVSRVKGTDTYFDELLAAYPAEMLGKGGKMRILVKILDSAVRLPAQAHPDKAFSRRHFGSEYGKTEAWLVLATRPGARIYFGFREGVTPEIFSAAIDESMTDRAAMERLMEWRTPEVGEVFLVPARTVHAIGAGCLILEVQEPTDFTIQPEHFCADYELDENEMYIGLSKEDAISCFSFERAPDTRITPKAEQVSDGVLLEHLITPEDTDCFIMDRVTLSGGEYTLNLPDSYCVCIVTDGEGSLVGEGYERPLARGDYFFMPHALMGRFSLRGCLTVALTY